MKDDIIPAKEFFLDYVKNAKKKEKNLGNFSGKMQFDFRKSNDGVFLITIQNGKILPLEVKKEEDPHADLTIITRYPDFYKVKTGQKKFWQLLLFRKVQIKGDKSFTKTLAQAGIN